MPTESGRQSEDIGPFTMIPGMNASTPEAALAPNEPEFLFNADIDRNGRVVGRPGSIFLARLGTGAILGAAEHTFESGLSESKLVAVVRNAYDTVNLLGSADDGSVAHPAGFCPDVERHGQPLVPISARETDRFHFQSFLNALYFAGSTIDYRLREHDYATGRNRVIDGVRGTAVVASGNRLFVAGDPVAPNLVFPSDPDDPYTFQEQLAFQVGTRTDRIVRLMDQDGMLVVFGRKTASWVLPGAIELGDLQTQPFSKEFGIVGALAACEAEDGWIYWCAPNRGLVRWRRGLPSPETDFALPTYELFRTVEKAQRDMSGTVVQWDSEALAVRMEVPGSNLVFSYFPDRQAWTFGASTTSLEALNIREYDVQAGALGEDRYTALVARQDPVDGNDYLFGGDAEGHIWRWRRAHADKRRSSLAGESGTAFTAAIRWGNVEIAPIGYRGLIERILIDYLGGYEFEFTVWSDLDYAGFLQLQTVSREIDGGAFPLLLGAEDASRLMNERLHPMHVAVSNWKRLIGKVIRIQMTWEASRLHMAFVGLEVERSIEPPAYAQIQTPVNPPGGNVHFLGDDGVGTEEDDGGTTEPHDPPDPEGIAAVPSIAQVGGANGKELDFVSADTVPPDTVPGDNLNVESTLSGNGLSTTSQPWQAVMDQDGVSLWTTGGIGRRYLMHFDLSGGLAAPPKSYTYDVVPDAQALGFGGAASNHGLLATFYSDVTQRLYIVCTATFGTSSGNTAFLLVYDVSTPTSAPTLIMGHSLGTQTGGHRIQGIELTPDDLYLFVGDSAETSPATGQYVHYVRCYQLSADALTLTPQGSVKAFPSETPQTVSGTGRMVGMSLRRAAGGVLYATLWNQVYLSAIDVSNPSSLSVLDEYSFHASADARGITINSDDTRAYVALRQNAALTKNAFAIVDIEDPTALSVVTIQDSNGAGVGVLGEAIHYVEAVDGPYVLFTSGGQIQSWDVSDELAPALISSDTITLTFAIGCAKGPLTIRYVSGGAPTPVAADIAVVSAFGSGSRGLAALVGLVDYTAPTLEAWVQDPALVQRNGPSTQFAPSGEHLVLIGGNEGVLHVYSLGASFQKVGEIQSNSLKGTFGLMRAATGSKLWTINASHQVIEIDLSDPTAPALTVTAAGPSYLPVPSAGPSLVARGEGNLVVDQNGPSLVSQSTRLRTGSLLPIELWGPKAVVIDATYAYCWNEVGGGGLAVVDHTSDSMPVIGYVHQGGMQPDVSMVKIGSYIYVAQRSNPNIEVFSVATPAAPAHIASHPAAGVVGLAANGANELVAFGLGSTRNSFTVRRINVTTPATPSDTATLTTTRVLSGGSVVNGKAVGFAENLAIGYTISATPVESSTVAIVGVGVQAFGFQDGGDFVAALALNGLSSRLVVIDAGTIGAVAIEGQSAVLASPKGWGFDPATGKGVALSNYFDGGGTIVYMMDVTSPAAPSIAAEYQVSHTQRHSYAAGVLGNVAVIGRDLGYGGLVVLDVTTLATPSVTRFVGDAWLATRNPSEWILLPIRGTSRAIAVASYPTGRVYEIDMTATDPRAGVYTELYASNIRLGPSSAAINDDGSLLFLGLQEISNVPDFEGGWRLECWDLADVGAIPARLGSVLVNRPIRAMRVSGTSNIVIIVHGGFRDVPKVALYDFTTPADPVKLGEVQLGDAPFIAHGLEIF